MRVVSIDWRLPATILPVFYKQMLPKTRVLSQKGVLKVKSIMAIVSLMLWRPLPYTRKFSRYEIFTEQEANRIFAIIFCGSQVHRGKVACYVLLQISNCCKLANFHGLNFRCISR